MLHKQIYNSPLGQMILLADDSGLLGAWFVGQKYALRGFEAMDIAEQPSPILTAAQVWLDAYFAGRKSQSGPPLSPQGTGFLEKGLDIINSCPQRSNYHLWANSGTTHLQVGTSCWRCGW